MIVNTCTVRFFFSSSVSLFCRNEKKTKQILPLQSTSNVKSCLLCVNFVCTSLQIQNNNNLIFYFVENFNMKRSEKRCFFYLLNVAHKHMRHTAPLKKYRAHRQLYSKHFYFFFFIFCVNPIKRFLFSIFPSLFLLSLRFISFSACSVVCDIWQAISVLHPTHQCICETAGDVERNTRLTCRD